MLLLLCIAHKSPIAWENRQAKGSFQCDKIYRLFFLLRVPAVIRFDCIMEKYFIHVFRLFRCVHRTGYNE